MADIDYDRLAETIVDALNRGGPNNDATKTAEEIRARQKNIEALFRQTKELKEANGAVQTLGRMFSGQKAKFNDVSKELEELDEQLKKTRDLDARTGIIKRKRELEQANAIQNVSAAFSNAGIAIAKFTTKIGETIAQAGADLVRNLQSNTTGVRTVSSMLTTGLSGIGAVGQGVSQGLTGLGAAAMLSKNKLMQLAGLGLTIFGTTLGFVTDKAVKLAKFGIEVLTVEIEKVLGAFKQASYAGAMFAGGMDELRQWSLAAGLSVDQFATVLKNNSSALAESGLTVSDGAKKVALVTNQFARTVGKSGQSMQREMLNLGYGFQEQAELSAQVISDLKRTGATATNAQMAQATVDLAKNMRIVADLTGKDAKQKMDQAKKQAEQYAFFAEVNRIARETNDPGLPKRVESALALMDETQRTAAIQSVVLNGVVTDVAANIYGMADPAKDFNNILRNGGATVEDLTKPMWQAGHNFTEVNGETARLISVANIASGALGNLAKAADSLGQAELYQDPKNLLRAQQNAEAAAVATGQLHNGVISAEQAIQAMRISIQDAITPALGYFATIVAETSEVMVDALNALKNSDLIKSAIRGDMPESAKEGAPAGKSRTESVVQGALTYGTIGTAAGAVLGGGLGLMAGGAGAVPGAIAGAKVGGIVGTSIGAAFGAIEQELTAISNTISSWFGSNTAKNARGGITTPGKLNIAGEAGPEAIIPLDQGRSVPVTLSVPEDYNRPGYNLAEFMSPIADSFSSIFDVTSIVGGVLGDRISEIASVADEILKLKNVSSVYEAFGILDTGMNNFVLALTNSGRILNDIFGSILDKAQDNYKIRSTEVNGFSDIAELLVKGYQVSIETLNSGVTQAVDSIIKSVGQINQQIADVDITESTADRTMSTDNAVASLIENFKSVVQIATATPTETVATNNTDLVNGLKSAIMQRNEPLERLLQEQNELLRLNANSLETLIGTVGDGNSINRRIYYEST